jgi:hypothetical protein
MTAPTPRDLDIGTSNTSPSDQTVELRKIRVAMEILTNQNLDDAGKE